ncbi:phage/plasmid replication protein, II/X family [Idiomarina loihiensis]|uniref:phage/plasmid replication protein, II/X family n=1 Tax=Idiomarina loihiensis TaxID=135577 RepID=UPI0031598D52
MIDWLTLVIPMKHPVINSGHFIELTPDGDLVREFAKVRTVKGSFSSSISLKTNIVSPCQKYGEQLYISGNPSKFLQGHNCFGSNDIQSLALGMVEQALALLDFELNDFSRQTILNGNYTVKRIDITEMFELPNAADVDAWIYAMSNSSKSRHGLPELTNRTLYFGKNSRRYATKMYSKFRELTTGKKEHALPQELLNSGILDWTINKVRIEHVLRAQELKKIAQDRCNKDFLQGKDLTPTVIEQLFNEYVGRIDMSGQITATDEKLQQLPSGVYGTYQLWKQGLDIRSVVSRATMFRHRKTIKDTLNIDIFLPPKQAKTNVIPLLRPLEAKPAQVPAELLTYQYDGEKQYATG